MANKVTEVFEKASHKAQRVAASAIVDRVLSKLYKDRTKAYLDIVDLVENFWKGDYPHEVFDKVREAIKDPDNRWIKYINSIIDETDKNVAKVTLLNMGFEAFIRGTKMIRKNREVYKCNIPWLILFDPTTACNMHCEGCWSGTYGHKFNLSFEDMDKIITQGKELGVYLYLLTGGAPTNPAASSAAGTVGYTDLLITWLFKITTGAESQYYLASVIGILVFVVIAVISLVVYNLMPSIKNEEDFR